MFKIGEIYRQVKYNNDDSILYEETMDGLSNYYYETHVEGFDNKFIFQRGIHKIKDVKGPDGNSRTPIIFISSSPHKAGSSETPWQDKYDPDRGYVRYYGDNKKSGHKAESEGNRVLLNLLPFYESGDKLIRATKAVPIVFFERTVVNNRTKGNLKFQGYGILEKAELITQYDSNKNEYFSNYLFHFCVFTLKYDDEVFDWNWIAKRCTSELTNEQTNTFAPKAWKKWIEEGKSSLHLVRRSLSVFDIVKKNEQIPKDKDKIALLHNIYRYYDGKKHNFEFLAMEVTKKVIEENGASCTPGWITKKSGDGGIDFVLRIDIGKEVLSGIKIIVLGQAKCTNPVSNSIDGRDVARTVARLKRGWVGAFVTTSFFSKPLQQELNEDKYPILLINGQKIAEIVCEALFNSKMDLDQYLQSLENIYKIERHIPEDVLYL